MSKPKFLDYHNYPVPDRNLIEKAHLWAEKAHAGQKRLSGDDYITHPVAVANYLISLNLDAPTIAAALLHDTLEDTDLTYPNIKKEFGSDIAFLVEAVTKLRKVKYSPTPTGRRTKDEYFDTLKKMFFAMAEDLRVILIRLSDRLHNMQTLQYLPAVDQKRIAAETLEIYAPIAARLGMGELKGELEDLAFRYVYPTEYAWLKKKIKDKYTDLTDYINRTRPIIERHLINAGIKIVSIHSRAKHIYSLYQKIIQRELDFSKIHDIVAMRIIVPDIKSCYETLGIIHSHYNPLPGLIKDFISLPKPNGYQSLHTTVFCEKGKVVEIQIRTPKMHEHNEKGIAAHWAYSESGKKSVVVSKKELQWINKLKDFLKEVKTMETFSTLKIDFFKNRIFVFTPKGEVEDLPEGATPIDFAYAIHTDLGHALRGAKINGRIAPIEHELKSGDVVEIIKGKEIKPSKDWLNIVKTVEAKKKIKAWFNSKLVETKIETPEREKKLQKRVAKNNSVITEHGIKGIPSIDGQRGLLYKIAGCCKPVPPREIKGYITLNRGISIHLATCANIRNAKNDRVLVASWSSK